MKELDEQIRATLLKEAVQQLNDEGTGLPLHEQVIELYSGRQRWLTIVATLGGVIATGLMVLVGYQFFVADDTKSQIAWSASFLTVVAVIALMKLWFWLEMNTNSITREIKRMELQLSLLSERITKD